METLLAESETDSYFPTKWPNGYPKQKDVTDTQIQRRTITKISHDRRTALERAEGLRLVIVALPRVFSQVFSPSLLVAYLRCLELVK